MGKLPVPCSVDRIHKFESFRQYHINLGLLRVSNKDDSLLYTPLPRPGISKKREYEQHAWSRMEPHVAIVFLGIFMLRNAVFEN